MCSNDKLYPCLSLVIHITGKVFQIALSTLILERISQVATTGQVHDPRRVNYLREHFLKAYEALSQGVPLKGYFVWSLLDNFEWAWGYSKRFGVVYVDYPTQRRIVKDSGKWYQHVLKMNGAVS